MPKKLINQPHDKIIKTILDNKKEVMLLINKVLKLKEHDIILEEKDIEKYNRKFITTTFENSEADIVYKIKNKNIFFLIEHQSKIDYAMSYRIMKYSFEIMESAIDKEKLHTINYKYPKVYPIVIYTGDKKWNVSNSFEAKQSNLYGLNEINWLKYCLVDINKITEDKLLENNSFLGKILLIEKSKTQEKIINSIEKVINTKLTPTEKEILKNLIYYILKRSIPKQKVEEFLKILEKKEEVNMQWVERLCNAFDEKYEEGLKNGIKRGKNLGIEQGKNLGINQGILSVAKNMLKKNMKVEDIQECTGLSKKEIQDLKLQCSKV